jgi:N-methylhydantoinase B
VARNAGTPNEEELSPKEYDIVLDAGETLLVVTPGAGGYGPPRERAHADVLRDVQEGKLSPEVAVNVYELSPSELTEVVPDGPA